MAESPVNWSGSVPPSLVFDSRPGCNALRQWMFDRDHFRHQMSAIQNLRMSIAPGEDDLQSRGPLVEEVEKISQGQDPAPHRPVNFIEDDQIEPPGSNPLPRHGKNPLHTGRNFLGRSRAVDHADPGIKELKTGEAAEAGQLPGLQGRRLEQPYPEDAPAMPERTGSQTGRRRRLSFARTGIDLHSPLNHSTIPSRRGGVTTKNPTLSKVGWRQLKRRTPSRAGFV